MNSSLSIMSNLFNVCRLLCVIRLAHINTPEIYNTPRDSEEYKKGIKSKEYVERRMKKNDEQFVIKTGKDTGKYGRY